MGRWGFKRFVLYNYTLRAKQLLTNVARVLGPVKSSRLHIACLIGIPEILQCLFDRFACICGVLEINTECRMSLNNCRGFLVADRWT